MNTVWSEEEREFVRQNSAILTDKEGSERLSKITGRNITLHSWRKQRQKLGVSKMPGRGVCKIREQE